MIDKAKYKNLLGFMESNNDYSIVNSIGAIGKYQFMPGTLNTLKSKYNLTDWKNQTIFRNSPALQELYIDALISDSLTFIENKNLNSFIGIPVKGSKRFKGINANLNIYGMLAGIHLAGATALENFLKSNIDPNDGFTSLSDYAAFFSSNINTFFNAFPILLAFMPAILLYYNK
jgi:hypothetical protein